jgi:hypothetical protein
MDTPFTIAFDTGTSPYFFDSNDRFRIVVRNGWQSFTLLGKRCDLNFISDLPHCQSAQGTADMHVHSGMAGRRCIGASSSRRPAAAHAVEAGIDAAGIRRPRISCRATTLR